MSENAYSQYEPTEGVRILEIEKPLSLNTMQNSDVDIELWDCGGSQRLRSHSDTSNYELIQCVQMIVRTVYDCTCNMINQKFDHI